MSVKCISIYEIIIVTTTVAVTHSSLHCEDGLVKDNFCVVNGGWTSWEFWGPCVGECGSIGRRTRRRTCSNPSPSFHGTACIGPDIQINTCQITGCTIDAYEKVARSNPVHKEEMKMVKAVHERVPALIELCFSANCGFPIVENVLGNDAMVYWNAMNCVKYGIGCPIPGGWSNWSAWSSCSALCGKGKKYRTRTCNNPRPSDPELNCDKLPFELNNCIGMNCKKHLLGTWTAWGQWSDCSVNCGIGIKSRTRSCAEAEETEVRYLNNEKTSCEGSTKEIDTCEIKDCSIDGLWSQWTAWSICSSGCGVGVQSRNRMCSNPSPSGTGAVCSGSATEVRQCFTKPCSVQKHKVAYFSGHSSLVYTAQDKNFRLLHVYVRFLPLNSFGTIIYRYKEDDFVKLFLKNGKVALVAQVSQCRVNLVHENNLEIGDWHNALIMIFGTYVLLRVDDGANKINFFSCTPLFPNLNHEMIVGTEFHGQLERIVLNFAPIPFHSESSNAFVNKHVEYFMADDEEGFVRIGATESLAAQCPTKTESWHVSITLKPEDTNGVIAIIPGNNINRYILLVLEYGHVKLKLRQGDTYAVVESSEHVVIREWIEIVLAQTGHEVYMQINGGRKNHAPIVSDEIAITCTDYIFIGAVPDQTKKNVCPACNEMPQFTFTVGLLYIDRNQVDLLSLSVQEETSKRLSSRTISSSDFYEEVSLSLGQQLKLSCFYDRNSYEERILPSAIKTRNVIWVLMDKPVIDQTQRENIFILNDDGRVSSISAASYLTREAIEGFYTCRIKHLMNGTRTSKRFAFTYGVAIIDENSEFAADHIWKSWASISCILIVLFTFTIVWLICEGIWDFQNGYGFFRYLHKTDDADFSSITSFLSSPDALVLLGSQEAVDEIMHKVLVNRLQSKSKNNDKDDTL